MNQTDNECKLITTFSQLTKLTKMLITLLKDEQAALAKNDTDTVSKITEQKKTYLHQIATAEQELFKIVNYDQSQPLPEVIQIFINKTTPINQSALTQQWQVLSQHLTECYKLNSITGGVIAANLEQTRRRLEILTQDFGNANTYDEKGNVE